MFIPALYTADSSILLERPTSPEEYANNWGSLKEDSEIVRIGGLLHDLGHGPFSHIFEQVITDVAKEKVSHAKITNLIIENDPDIKKALSGLDVTTILSNNRQDSRCEILSGSLDADRLDYLRRDSYHTGVAYGVFDFERIVRNLCIINDGERDYIGIHEKGKDAAESYRLARYLMHTQVYEHHTRLIAEDMFLQAIKCALEESIIDQDALNPKGDIHRFLNYYLSLDDYSLQYLILSKSRGRAGALIADIQNRNLLKRAYMVSISSDSIPDYTQRMKFLNMKASQIENLKTKIASSSGLDIADLIVHLQHVEIKLYEDMEDTHSEEKPLLVKRYNGQIRHMREESPFSATPIPRKLYVFCKEDAKKIVAKAAEEVIGVKNQIK